MLYPKNKSDNIDIELFRNPSSEYRCTPFWAWNCDLKKDILFDEIKAMKEMGMGGFHMHTRVGMSTKYLSDEYMALIKECAEKAKENNMLAWLYDEDKWPSGFAGGYVTKKKENRQKFLMVTATPYKKNSVTSEQNDASGLAGRSNNGTLLARYSVTLDDDGYLSAYKRLEDGEKATGRELFAYIETPGEGPWYNFQTYVDTLSKSAINDFVNITHERYKQVVGNDFGKSVPAIFTDEPQVTTKTVLDYSKEEKDIILPFTTDFDDTYRAQYGESILDKLPEVIWNKKGTISVTRYRYHDHCTERFVSAYCDTIGNWCKKNNILLTGHMMNEATLESQTISLGEAMRAYRSFGLPGVDMLCNLKELTTVKQAASATHQYGYPGVTSELYGVTNWDFDFRGHKIQGDWQAALGITVRVPHLYWVSMHGEAKRDYPASIGHQSCWYKQYPFIENHFARVNTLMTRGKADIKIGVIHPIESYWINFGPNDLSHGIKSQLNDSFMKMSDWLLSGALDYDYICESTLPSLYKKTESGFAVGEMKYDVVVVSMCQMLRSTTLDALEEFQKNGGKIIFVGKPPIYVDAVKSDRAEKLAGNNVVDYSADAIYKALEPYRQIKIMQTNGSMASSIYYGLRDDGENKNLFLCHYNLKNPGHVRCMEEYYITVKGIYKPVVFDTITGKTYPIGAKYEFGNTVIDWKCYEHSSLLLRLEKGMTDAPFKNKTEVFEQMGYLMGSVPITLDEPNVCVLDMAKWKIDDGEWFETEESLRIGVKAKKLLNMPVAASMGAQPWVAPAEKAKNTITLEYTLHSDVDVENAELALEDFEDTEILYNGKKVEKNITGCYVDYSISKVSIGKILKGDSTITVTKPFAVMTNTENIFILGDFGVKVAGTDVRLTEPVKSLYFGSWTTQGLPFYGGKVTYHCTVDGGENTSLALGVYYAPAVTVSIDGSEPQNVSLAPYRADLGKLDTGKHLLDINVYASRINTFGMLHLCNSDCRWFGPDAWRTANENWMYEYNVMDCGLISAPRILKKQ